LKPKKCLKCQTMNISAAEFCKSCGVPITP
jgi:hypothetical protein